MLRSLSPQAGVLSLPKISTDRDANTHEKRSHPDDEYGQDKWREAKGE